MAILNKLTDVTYQNEIYDKLCGSDILCYIYRESVVVREIYSYNNQPWDLELLKEIMNILDMYTLEARFMPNDMLYIFCKQYTYTDAPDPIKFELVDSDGKCFTTIRDTECPICSIFVNDDIITIRKLCDLLRIGELSMSVDEIVLAIGLYLEYDIIDKGTDIVTLIPHEKSSTDK